mmetsp:Transcript_6154/g.17517  ORF Transcript_6154/g.17517 Transcript_6154/m.17517 type:complete len:354 (+) Transcript_6154:1480-2541(+)
MCSFWKILCMLDNSFRDHVFPCVCRMSQNSDTQETTTHFILSCSSFIMPKNNKGGRRNGSNNYSEVELRHCFAILREVRPIGPDEWQQVADRHADKYPGRDVDSIRRKYSSCHRKQVPTGDPNCPWEIREAKYIKYLIGLKAEVGDGEDLYDMEANGGTGAFVSVSTAPPDPGSTIATREETQTTASTTGTAPCQQFTDGVPLGQPSQLTVDDPDMLLLAASTSTEEGGEGSPPPPPSRPGTPGTPNSNSSGKRPYRRSPSGPPDDSLIQSLKNTLEMQTRALINHNKLQEDANKEAKAHREQSKTEAKEDRKMLIEALKVAICGRRKKKKRRRHSTKHNSSSSSSSSDDNSE